MKIVKTRCEAIHILPEKEKKFMRIIGISSLTLILKRYAFIIFCLILCAACAEEEKIEITMIITLDGWYNDTFRKSLNAEYTSLSFTFRDRYEELEINECVFIEADTKRIYPKQQRGDNFIIDLMDVDVLIIKSIHPGKDWVPYSREITLYNVIFHK